MHFRIEAADTRNGAPICRIIEADDVAAAQRWVAEQPFTRLVRVQPMRRPVWESAQTSSAQQVVIADRPAERVGLASAVSLPSAAGDEPPPMEVAAAIWAEPPVITGRRDNPEGWRPARGPMVSRLALAAAALQVAPLNVPVSSGLRKTVYTLLALNVAAVAAVLVWGQPLIELTGLGGMYANAILINLAALVAVIAAESFYARRGGVDGQRLVGRAAVIATVGVAVVAFAVGMGWLASEAPVTPYRSHVPTVEALGHSAPARVSGARR